MMVIRCVTCSRLASAHVFFCWLAIQALVLTVVQGEELKGKSSDLPETMVSGGRPLPPPIFTLAPQAEIERLVLEAHLESNILQIWQNSLEIRAIKVAELLRCGLATALQLEEAKIQWANARDRYAAASQCLDLAERLRTASAGAGGKEIDNEEVNQAPAFHLRIPGLSLRLAGQDFFTARLAAHSSVTKALLRYERSRLFQLGNVPHRGALREFLEDRHAALSSLPSVRSSELEPLSVQLAISEQRQQQAELTSNARLRDEQQLREFHLQITDQEQGEMVSNSAFPESEIGFWLMGDGKAAPVAAFSMSEPALACAREKAASNSETMAKTTLWQASSERYQQLTKLHRSGYAGDRELRDAALEVELARFDKEIAKATQTVAQLEYQQAAAAQPAALPPIALPASQDAGSWHAWFQNRQPSDPAARARFLEIARLSFLCSAERSICQRELAFRQRRASAYANIRSARQTELALQKNLVAQASAQLDKAQKEENLSLLELRQWASFQEGNEFKNLAPSLMTNVLEAGRKVIAARIEAARLHCAREETRYRYDLDCLERLQALRARGSVRDYELQAAYHQAQRSRGDAVTARKAHAILQHELALHQSLFDSGCLSYSEADGLEVIRWTPESIGALQSLVKLREGGDSGQMTRIEADLANLDVRLGEMKRLVSSGHASPVELQNLEMWKKNAEIALALESNREEVLKAALGVVKSLQGTPVPPAARLPATSPF